MERFGEYVEYYNNLDVSGLVEGIEKIIKVKVTDRLDMFKDSVSLPGLTQRQLFKHMGDDYFTIFEEEHKHLYKEIRESIV